jgi:hypothetical protein
MVSPGQAQLAGVILHVLITMPSVLANSPTDSGHRGEGQRLPSLKVAATEAVPTPQADKGSL